MIHLRSISLNPTKSKSRQSLPDSPEAPVAFPFNVPVIRSLSELAFTSEVTFLVGENGSGKSTLLEGLALSAGLPTVGSENVESDRSLVKLRDLSRALKLVWSKKAVRGFFMRSEDFFGFVKKQAAMREEMERDLKDIEQEYDGKSKYAHALARMPYMRELHDMRQHYGDDLDARSHGESYFTLFQSRFVPDGLYLLDEPEAPLSPMRQIIFLSMLRMMVNQNAQFIIATHSPIILAYPGAVIYSCDGGKIEPVDYDKLDHVQITRSFLSNPDQYLSRLFAEL